jgi:hypothetical protein
MAKLHIKQHYALINIGHPKHLDAYVNHPNEHYRENVAFSGNDNHRKKLLNDPNWLVRTVARKVLENPKYTFGSDEHEDDMEKYHFDELRSKD